MKIWLLFDEDDSRSSSRVREHGVFCLFHNFMWQSRYSEVNVHLVDRCGRTSWLSYHNGSPRSIMMCIYVFVCVRGVSWSEVATVPKRKSHRGLDLDLSLNSEVNIRKGWKRTVGRSRRQRDEEKQPRRNT